MIPMSSSRRLPAADEYVLPLTLAHHAAQTPDSPFVPLRSAGHCRKRHEDPNAPDGHQVGSSSILSKGAFGISIRRPILMLGI